MRRQSLGQSKDFKKKEAPLEGKTQQLDLTKLSELKSKLDKERQLMKTTTGRRFRDTDARSSQSSFTGKVPLVESKKILSQERTLRQNEKPSNSKVGQKPPSAKKKEAAVATKPLTVTSNRISLTELDSSANDSFNEESLRSSRTFEIEKDIQKAHNKEIYQFLKKIRLESFYDSFLAEGLDNLQEIEEISIDRLNGMKMKAKQQRILFQEIDKRKKGSIAIGTNDYNPFNMTESSISSRNRIQTEPNIPVAKKIPTQQSIIQPKPKKIGNMNTSYTSAFHQRSASSSFLYSAGGNQWNMGVTGDAQMVIRQRKACCFCFKMTYQPVQNGFLFYCSKQCVDKDTKPKKRHSPTKKQQESETKSTKAKTELPPKPVSKQVADNQTDIDFLDMSLDSNLMRDYGV